MCLGEQAPQNSSCFLCLRVDCVLRESESSRHEYYKNESIHFPTLDYAWTMDETFLRHWQRVTAPCCRYWALLLTIPSVRNHPIPSVHLSCDSSLQCRVHWSVFSIFKTLVTEIVIILPVRYEMLILDVNMCEIRKPVHNRIPCWCFYLKYGKAQQ